MNWPHPKTAGTVALYARGAQAPAAGMVQRARARRGKVGTALRRPDMAARCPYL